MLYRGWGLGVASEFGLPLARGAGAADVRIVAAGGAGEVGAARLEWGEDAALVAWPGFGAFALRGGHTVEAAPAPDVSEAGLGAALAGPVLALLLLQRGALVLHASAVALRQCDGTERAVAFVGEAGAGKSTLAAALVARGHRPLCDDTIALYPDAGVLMIEPGTPLVKLRPASLRAFGQPVEGATEEEGRPVAAAGWQGHAAPLCALIAPTWGASARLEPLDLPAALGCILRHSYAAGLLPTPPPADFARAAKLARRVPTLRFERPRDWGCLEAGLRLLEAGV